jgi:hypothetical protein
MMSLHTILRTPIPGLKRRKPRVRRAPWILRVCPQRIRPYVEFILVFVGYAAIAVLLFTALYAIILIPLLMAHILHPDRPIATAPIHWLRQHFSHDVAFDIYLGICFLVWAILVYAWKVFDYLWREAVRRKYENVA